MFDFHLHSIYSDGDEDIATILRTALRRGLKAIAITDHADAQGKFMYLRTVEEPKPLSAYINEIKQVRKDSPIPIYIGLEICEFSSNYEENIPILFNSLDFILVETFAVQNPSANRFNPLKEAIKLKEIFSIPIGLAHPNIDYIVVNIDEIEKNNIFLELNSDKLFRDPIGKDNTIKKLKDAIELHPNIKLSVGSDAHIMFTIGAIKDVMDFIVANDFMDKIIFND
ncbi:MAG: PHP domain-containing protein [Candidatus Lokiarchaeota archaeon]|nr:PHP domain-containing protein [Candidatus Lokiarchaeota archaeon]